MNEAPNSETALPADRSPLHGLLEAAPDAIVIVDLDGKIVTINRLTEELFGYGRQELIGQPVELLVPARARDQHVAHRQRYAQEPRTRPMGEGQDLAGRRKDGTEFPVEISLSPLDTEQGRLVISIIRDTTQRHEAEERLKASLREKEVLLKEIHHRVKNNLQVISSLLKLQSSYIQDRRARELFEESQGRIRSMALVHEKLYQSSDLSRIDFSEYVESLSRLLLRSFGAAARRVELKVRGDKIFLAIDTAVPCGLIVNELLTNCLKHAFPGGRAGTIAIDIRAEEGRRFCLSVRDDGVGLPAHVEIGKASTLGLQLVKALAAQLRADLEVVRDAGTVFRMRFSEGKP